LNPASDRSGQATQHLKSPASRTSAQLPRLTPSTKSVRKNFATPFKLPRNQLPLLGFSLTKLATARLSVPHFLTCKPATFTPVTLQDSPKLGSSTSMSNLSWTALGCTGSPPSVASSATGFVTTATVLALACYAFGTTFTSAPDPHVPFISGLMCYSR